MATVVDSNICRDLMPFDGKSTPFIRNEKAKNRQYVMDFQKQHLTV